MQICIELPITFTNLQHSDYIISKFRIDKNDKNTTVQPEEFTQFILEQLRTVPADKLNVHWAPQYTMCPYCLLNFTVYSFLPENTEDAIYFFKKAGLLDKVEISLKARNTSADGNKR